jgi:hypothetical protein
MLTAMLSQELRATFVMRDQNDSTSQLNGDRGSQEVPAECESQLPGVLQDTAQIHEA